MNTGYPCPSCLFAKSPRSNATFASFKVASPQLGAPKLWKPRSPGKTQRCPVFWTSLAGKNTKNPCLCYEYEQNINFEYEQNINFKQKQNHWKLTAKKNRKCLESCRWSNKNGGIKPTKGEVAGTLWDLEPTISWSMGCKHQIVTLPWKCYTYHLITRGWTKTLAIRSDFDLSFQELGF